MRINFSSQKLVNCQIWQFFNVSKIFWPLSLPKKASLGYLLSLQLQGTPSYCFTISKIGASLVLESKSSQKVLVEKKKKIQKTPHFFDWVLLHYTKLFFGFHRPDIRQILCFHQKISNPSLRTQVDWPHLKNRQEIQNHKF